MKKTLIQGLIIIACFFATWFVLSQVDWINILKIKKVTNKTEEKLGELFWDIFDKSEKEIKNPFIISTIDSIVNTVCSANGIDRSFIKLHLCDNDEINAFALPNGHIVIYSGLILVSNNQGELSGVICHELAHIQLNHVMKKLVKEIGLSVLLSMTTGNSGSEIIKKAAKLLSSSAYDRSLEQEADIKAVDYLVKAHIDPEHFANFIYRLSEKEHEAMKYLSWTSTHPESKERAEYILEYSKNKEIEHEEILSGETWELLKEKLMNK
ncbi:MAG: M48 family metallopeptidase [Cyclobacteriaceae bacterium]